MPTPPESAGKKRNASIRRSIVAQRGVLSPQRFEPRFSDWNVSWDLTATGEISDDVTAFGTYARTFKSGGVNLNGVPNDAAGNPIWNRDLLASEPTLVLEPKQVVTFVFNPRAAWYDGAPFTWEDFYWQWRANNGSDSRYQISSANGWEAIENIARGRDDREAVVTFQCSAKADQGTITVPSQVLSALPPCSSTTAGPWPITSYAMRTPSVSRTYEGTVNLSSRS